MFNQHYFAIIEDSQISSNKKMRMSDQFGGDKMC